MAETFLLVQVAHPDWWEGDSVAAEMTNLMANVVEGSPLLLVGVWCADLGNAVIADQSDTATPKATSRAKSYCIPISDVRRSTERVDTARAGVDRSVGG